MCCGWAAMFFIGVLYVAAHWLDKSFERRKRSYAEGEASTSITSGPDATSTTTGADSVGDHAGPRAAAGCLRQVGGDGVQYGGGARAADRH